MQIYYFGIKFASNFVKGDYDKMTKFIDYYKILGVKKDIPQDEVKAAYRKRSKQFHPDLHPNDPKAKAKFQLLNEAYEVINDPEKRKLYDQYGENWDKAKGMGGMNGAGGFSGLRVSAEADLETAVLISISTKRISQTSSANSWAECTSSLSNLLKLRQISA